MKKYLNVKRIISLCTALVFLGGQFSPLVYGQSVLNLPKPGTMVGLSETYYPTLLRGMTIHPNNPLQFDFILDSGNEQNVGKSLEEEGQRLVNYFLTAMTIPRQDLWVNLSPLEKDRIVPDALIRTELGREFLAQDYLLKQLASSLIYPESVIGKRFWDRVYALAQQRLGTSDIPVNVFNKVWIMPDQASVYEKGNTVYVTSMHLKVMLESDYLASKNGKLVDNSSQQEELFKQVYRDMIIPVLEKEVNEGKNFMPLRQSMYSLVLAQWYQDALKEGVLKRAYAGKSKVGGIDAGDPANRDTIYRQYKEAYKKGVFNYIKEDSNVAIRKYFSGGVHAITKIPISRESSPPAAAMNAKIMRVNLGVMPNSGDASNITRRQAIRNIVMGAAAVMFTPSGMMQEKPTMTGSSNQTQELIELEFKAASRKTQKRVVRTMAELARFPEYKPWDDLKSEKNVIPILNILRRFEQTWMVAIRNKDVSQGVMQIRQAHAEAIKAIKQELGRQQPGWQPSVQFQSALGTEEYAEEFTRFMFIDVANFLAAQGLVFVPLITGVFTWQQLDTQTGKTSMRTEPLLGGLSLSIVNKVDPWDLIGDISDLRKEGIRIQVVQPAGIKEGKDGVESIEFREESMKEKGGGEIGQAFAGRVLMFRRDFINEAQDQLRTLISEKFKTGELLIYVDDLSLREAFEGVEFHRDYPAGLKVDGPISIDLPDINHAASYAAMKIITRGALEHLLQTKSPSTGYLLRMELKTLAHHEWAHIQRSRTQDRMMRTFSWLHTGGSIFGISKEDLVESELLEELDVRLASFGAAPDMYLVEALIRNGAWDKTGKEAGVPFDLEIIWAMIDEIRRDPDPLKSYGIQVERNGFKVIPGKNMPAGNAKPEITLDVETQIMAQLYRIVEKPERARALEVKIRRSIKLRERQEAFVKKHAHLDPWTDEEGKPLPEKAVNAKASPAQIVQGGIDARDIDIDRQGTLMQDLVGNEAIEQMINSSPGLKARIVDIKSILNMQDVLK